MSRRVGRRCSIQRGLRRSDHSRSAGCSCASILGMLLVLRFVKFTFEKSIMCRCFCVLVVISGGACIYENTKSHEEDDGLMVVVRKIHAL